MKPKTNTHTHTHQTENTFYFVFIIVIILNEEMDGSRNGWHKQNDEKQGPRIQCIYCFLHAKMEENWNQKQK